MSWLLILLWRSSKHMLIICSLPLWRVLLQFSVSVLFLSIFWIKTTRILYQALSSLKHLLWLLFLIQILSILWQVIQILRKQLLWLDELNLQRWVTKTIYTTQFLNSRIKASTTSSLSFLTSATQLLTN